MRVFLLLGVCVFFSSCGVIKGHTNWFVDKGIKTVDRLYVPDNGAEEKLEDVIEAVTGLETDLSPANGDPNDKGKS